MTSLASGLPEFVGDDEDLARFITQSGDFTAAVAKPKVFLPSQRDRETSISRHGREPVDDLWVLGAAAAGTRKLYGAAMFKGRDVRHAQLDVLAAEPPLRHAVIKGWPWIDSDPELQKAKQKELALVLASAAGPPLLRQQP